MSDGFSVVQHDGLNDATVTGSVFHQLHCLVYVTTNVKCIHAYISYRWPYDT